MNNKFMDTKKDNWIKVKRIFAIVVAISLLIASMQFSFAGFNFNVSEMAWLGWVLSIAVTAIELVFNTDIRRLNLTLFSAGILAYLYGVSTNVMGFYAAQGGTSEKFLAHPESILFAIMVGAFLEIVPEPLLIWGLGVNEDGDFLSNLIRGKKNIDNRNWTDKPNAPYIVPPQVPSNSSYRPIVNGRNKANGKHRSFDAKR